ncbi:MAG: hypothetical protein V4629_04225 [Pseudomonadota bacterium]
MNLKTSEINPIELEVFQNKLKQLTDLVEADELEIKKYRIQRQLLLRCLEAQLDFNTQPTSATHNYFLNSFQKNISQQRAVKSKVYGRFIFLLSIGVSAVVTWFFLNENAWRSALLNF